jgi:hypothetical protein
MHSLFRQIVLQVKLKPSPAMVGVFSKRISDKVPLGKTKGIL